MKVAVVLSGCGHFDGAEIRESLIAMMALEKEDVQYQCFAPAALPFHPVNHLTGDLDPQAQAREVMVEAARIARGDMQPLADLECQSYNALVIPGGYGVAKNLSDIAAGGKAVLPDMQKCIAAFHSQKKPIAAICIAPALVVAALNQKGCSPKVTLGKDDGGMIAKLGGIHQDCRVDSFVHDEANNIFSTPAYMLDGHLMIEIAAGIDKMIATMISNSKH